jgi:hypothetical protein
MMCDIVEDDEEKEGEEEEEEVYTYQSCIGGVVGIKNIKM